jgi:hypothetical protein
MPSSKELFINDKILRDKLAAVTGSDWFAEALMYVRSELMDGEITEQELSGAKKFQKILMTLADPTYVAPEPLKTGLTHNIDNPRTEKTEKKE